MKKIMLFFLISLFPKIFNTSQEAMTEGIVVAISGKISVRNDEKSILVDKIKKL